MAMLEVKLIFLYLDKFTRFFCDRSLLLWEKEAGNPRFSSYLGIDAKIRATRFYAGIACNDGFVGGAQQYMVANTQQGCASQARFCL